MKRVAKYFFDKLNTILHTKLRAKLHGTRGFTLTELLVTVAVMALSGAALTLGLNSSVQIYNQIKISTEAQVLASTLETAITDELRFARDITVTGSGDTQTITWTGDRAGSVTRLETTDTGFVKLSSQNGTGGRVNTDLIPESAYTSNLAAEAVLTYSDETTCFTVKLVIYNRSSAHRWVEGEFAVRPLNRP